MSISFFVDIDGVLATDPGGHYRALYLNRELNFGVPQEQITTLAAFCRIPEIFSYITMETQQFEQILSEGQHDFISHENAVPVDGAIEAVQRLDHMGGSISYFTCRRKSAQEITEAWLRRYHFPNPERLFMCADYGEKLITAHEQTKNERVVIIDDRAVQLLRMLKPLKETRMDVVLSVFNRFSLLVFGKKEMPKMPAAYRQKLNIRLLPSWKEVFELRA